MKIFEQLEFVDFLESLDKFLLVMIIVRQFDDIFLLLAYQSGRQNQEIGANRIQGGGPIFFGQTQTFEPMNDIGSKKKQLKERHIGLPGIAGNFGERIIVEELAIVLFDSGPGIVEQINAPSRHGQVGNEDMINVLGIFEEGKLFGFLGIFGNRASHNDEAMRVVPLLVNIFEEFPHLPTVLKFLESTSPCPALNDGVLFDSNHVTASGYVEKSDDPLPIESRIHAKTDSTSGYIRWHFGQTDFQKGHGSRKGNGVARSQRTMPEFLPVSLETKHRMVTSSSLLLWIVTDFASLLFAVDRDHDRIDIECQTRGLAGQFPQIRPQTVVKPDQLSNRLRTQSLQKSPQGRLIGESLQTQHRQKRAIVLQDFGLVDSPQAHDDGVKQCQDQLGRMIKRILLNATQMSLQQSAQIQFVAKTLNQPHPPEMGYIGFLEGKLDCPDAFAHMTQSSPLGYFLSQHYFALDYTLLPSLFEYIQRIKSSQSRTFED